MGRPGEEDVYGRAARRLREEFVDALLFELDLPHVVICTSMRTGHVSLIGPYDDAMAAICAAEQERAAESAAGAGSELVFTVSPLHPPEEP